MINKFKQNNCNELHIKYDSKSNCTFIIALNTTYSDKGNGGTRMKNYSSVGEGIEDALKLANAMTKKCIAIGNKNNGGYTGAKGVIIGDPKTQKTQEMLRSYGEFVESLNGRFQTGCDMNITSKDLKFMAEKTRYVDGLLSTGLGDGGFATAYGIVTAMKTLCRHKYGNSNLSNKTIAVQGMGSVGSNLVRLLIKENANLIITDIDSKKIEKIKSMFNVRSVDPDKIYNIHCDIFSPNACGDVLTLKNIKKLNCKMIIGGANNPLKSPLLAIKELQKKRILFVPDYIANLGAQVLSICEIENKSLDYALNNIKKIIETRLLEIILESEKNSEAMFTSSERIISGILSPEIFC